MSILEKLIDPCAWEDFRQYKAAGGHCTHEELERMDAFIEERAFSSLEAPVLTGDVAAMVQWFGHPTQHIINKQGSRKKRTVFCYPEAQTLCLKLLTHLLYHYDDAMSPACYSFRRGLTAKDAWDTIMATPRLEEKHVLKADIHDYFNSIDTQVLANELEAIIDDDALLLAFLQQLMCDEQAYVGSELQRCRRGAMAGVPVSAFMANIYLKSLDELFCEAGVPYLRYSDDILILADTSAQAADYLARLEEHIAGKGLELNREKTVLAKPGQAWDFLGFKYIEGRIGLSDAILAKTKAKIKRKARALYRWRKRKGVGYERTARTMVRIFDRKFFDVGGENRFTWTRWFFPVLTSTEGLAELDRYFAYYLRYLKTGRHSKVNYRVSYEDLKKFGYTSLVGEYHQYRADSARLRDGTYRSV